MHITLISSDIVWEDKAANFSLLEKLFAGFSSSTDLVVLPEMFATGFTMNKSLAEDLTGETLKWMQSVTAKYNFALMGSMPFRLDSSSDEAKCTNRAFFVYPDGSYKFYDKRHLFRMGDENNHYTGGDQRCIVEYKGVKINLNICYDIRFPVWTRNIGNDYDLLINIANFPDSRVAAIEPLIRARAIENQAYAMFVNRIGDDSTCHYIASSLAVDFKGNIIGKEVQDAATDAIMPGVQIIEAQIDVESLREFRKNFPAWMDSDNFTINL